jgi:hypothetical protein
VSRHDRDLRLYGAVSDTVPLGWPWVEQQLAGAWTYWVNVRTPGYPHPRPVWGVWVVQRLHLSIGSPTLRRAIRQEHAVTIHLDSGTDVVIVEGLVTGSAATMSEVIEAYNRKYDWDFQVSQYGELTEVQPGKVLGWRTAGLAGRDSFQSTGCWIFDDRD